MPAFRANVRPHGSNVRPSVERLTSRTFDHVQRSTSRTLGLANVRPVERSTGRTLGSPQTLTKCARNAHGMLTKCSRNAPKIIPKCSQNAQKMLTKCSQNDTRMLIQRSRNAPEMLTKCSPTAHKMLTKWLQAWPWRPFLHKADKASWRHNPVPTRRPMRQKPLPYTASPGAEVGFLWDGPFTSLRRRAAPVQISPRKQHFQ